MNKRLAALSLALCLALTGCGGSKREPSEKAIAIGKSALVTVDDYLDKKIGYDEADKRIESFYDDMDYVSDEDNRQDEHHAKDFGIRTHLSSISIYMMSDHNNDGEAYTKLLDARNELAEDIGEKKR